MSERAYKTRRGSAWAINTIAIEAYAPDVSQDEARSDKERNTHKIAAKNDVRSDKQLRVRIGAVRFSMKQNRYEEGKFSSQGRGLGTVTEEMVRRRARELAVTKGRGEDQVLDSDLEQARQELTEGPVGFEEDETPESKRWDPVPGTEPTSPTVVPAPDEQTFAEKLVKEGVRDAEHERMLDATRESLKRDREEA